VRAPGRGDGKNKPSVALQGHLDIVCSKNEEDTHDFDKDGLEVFFFEKIETVKKMEVYHVFATKMY
jgi:di/tripeptidase